MGDIIDFPGRPNFDFPEDDAEHEQTEADYLSEKAQFVLFLRSVAHDLGEENSPLIDHFLLSETKKMTERLLTIYCKTHPLR